MKIKILSGLIKKNKLVWLGGLAGLVLIGLLISSSSRANQSSRLNFENKESATETETLDSDSGQILDASHFFNDRLFYPAIKSAQKLESKSASKVKAVVVPHHLVGSELIANAFTRANQSFHPKQVIILGPNHFEAGQANIVTTKADWKTNFGTLLALGQIETKLTNSGLNIENNQTVFKKEHAIGNLVHFVKYYFPEARLDPVIFSSQTELAQVESFSQQLNQIDLSETLIIASIDFCHDLDQSQAFKNHQTVLQLIKDKDYDTLLRLKNDHLDSGPSLVTLLLLAEKNDWQFSVIDQAHSSQFLDQPGHKGTSYMELIFSELNYDSDYIL